MRVKGAKPHDPGFLESIEEWIKRNKLKVKVLLFASSRWAIALCTPGNKFDWVVFWSPWLREAGTKYVDRIVRFYDLECIPKINRTQIERIVNLWEVSK